MLLAVIVLVIIGFEISLFPNLQRALTQKNVKFDNKKKHFFFIFTRHSNHYPLSAPSCNGFRDIKFSMAKFAKGDYSKKLNDYIFNFHQVINFLSSTSGASLKLLAVMVFEISCFLFAKGNISKKYFFLFSPIDLLIISYKLSKFEAPSCYSF